MIRVSGKPTQGIEAMSANTTSQSLDAISDRLARLEEHRIADRLARLEESVENIKATMATTADVEGVKTLIAETKALIAEKEAAQARWLLGIMAAASTAVAVAVIRTFIG